MAVFADVARLKMCHRVFARRVGTVMAAKAVTHDVDVIKIRGQPADGRVTVITIVAAIDMVRVFPGRLNAVMTGTAVADYLRVIDSKYRYPDVRRMTVFANVGRLNMRQVLARRISAVMTAETIARDVYVIKIRRQPANRRMTVITIVTAVYVRRMLAARRNTIMTGATRANHLRMVHEIGRRPYIGVVAIFADIAGLNVRKRLAACFRAIVATDAIARNIHMVEIGRPPANRRVTIVTGVTAVYVCGVLAGCREAVMT